MPQIKFELAGIHSILGGNLFRRVDNLEFYGGSRSLFAVPPPWLTHSLTSACPFGECHIDDGPGCLPIQTSILTLKVTLCSHFQG
jgi:hypothetical protein